MMDNLASIAGVFDQVETDCADLPAVEAAERETTLLIRTAKLVTSHGEFACVVRDVSHEGVSIRLFHAAPQGDPIELHMPGGGVYELNPQHCDGCEANYSFVDKVDLDRLINEVGEFPKRALRLGIVFPVKVRTMNGDFDGLIENLSQQGARLICDGLFAIDQSLRIESLDGVTEYQNARAKVRWRREDEYGLVFDNTMTLGDFARFAARVQCPVLLR